MSEEQKNVAASVKWFKADKGYGFVRFADGSGEAFLHSSVLTSLGDVTLVEGMSVVCDVAEGQKGPQVTAIHSITPAAAQEPKPRPQRGRRGRPLPGEAGDGAPMAEPGMAQPAPQPREPREPRQQRRQPEPMRAASDELMLGSVRWYNLDSQSGIIEPADGGESVFFDRVTLRRSGLDIVADGEDVWFAARDTRDGWVAEHVELAPTTSTN
ncbi:cold shock domain-containing protein [Azospirillum sp. sgz301742]